MLMRSGLGKWGDCMLRGKTNGIQYKMFELRLYRVHSDAVEHKVP